MMGFLREWIVGITAVAVLLAAARSLMPAGSVKKVGELAGGLLLLLVMAAPLMELDVGQLAASLAQYRVAEAGRGELLEIENMELVKELIAGETAAYISDKASELGAACTAEVTMAYGADGTVWPESAVIRGTLTEGQRAALTARIAADLGIPAEKQTYEEVSAP